MYSIPYFRVVGGPLEFIITLSPFRLLTLDLKKVLKTTKITFYIFSFSNLPLSLTIYVLKYHSHHRIIE